MGQQNRKKCEFCASVVISTAQLYTGDWLTLLCYQVAMHGMSRICVYNHICQVPWYGWVWHVYVFMYGIRWMTHLGFSLFLMSRVMKESIVISFVSCLYVLSARAYMYCLLEPLVCALCQPDAESSLLANEAPEWDETGWVVEGFVRRASHSRRPSHHHHGHPSCKNS